MTSVWCDPEAVRAALSRIGSLTQELDERRQRMLASWEETRHDGWNDGRSRAFDELLRETLDRISASLDLLASRCDALRGRMGTLDAYLGAGAAGGAIGAGPTGSSDAGTRGRARAKSVRRGGPTGRAVPSRSGEKLILWSFAGWTPARVEWDDPDFPVRFEHTTHHGNTAEIYRRWVRRFAAVLGRIDALGWDAIDSSSADGQVRDVFLGSEVVEISQLLGDRIRVLSGRHRVMAAIQLGRTIPVRVRE